MDQDRRQQLSDAFEQRTGSRPTTWVRAPGRVELMGSHTDYNEGFALTMATDRDTWIAARPRADRRVCVTSVNFEETVEFAYEDVPLHGHWNSYMHGVLWVMLMNAYEFPGFDAIVDGNVPLRSGLSSSASLSVGTAKLAMALGGLIIDDLHLAQICRQSENDIVGVPCGILDQYSSVFAESDCAMLLDCRALTHQQVGIPPNLHVVVCDTRAPRQLVDSAYAERRSDCETAVRQIFGDGSHDGKTLRDVTVPQFKAVKAQLTDRLRARAEYIINENQRVLDTADALNVDDQHAIRRLCEASFDEADSLYEIVTDEMRAMRDAAASAPGVIGVRNSGGGFGGCLIAFVDGSDTDDFIAHTTSAYQSATRIRPQIFRVRGATGASVMP